MTLDLDKRLAEIASGNLLHPQSALALAEVKDTAQLMQAARQLRNQQFGNVITFSKKAFMPLTQLCRNVCHYCTFAKSPKRVESPYMHPDEVILRLQAASKAGCKEALLTLGEKPEIRYSAAASALAEMGFSTTLEYVAHVAGRILNETELLPHINAGCMTPEEINLLRPVSASMGVMLESSSQRLCQKGMPHYGSPDKEPALRLATIEAAGKANVPFTSGILIGIGETRIERIESLLALRDLHQKYGHLQEIIIQNFRAKPDTKMKQAAEPPLEDLLWTIAIARHIFGTEMSLQAPPNLSNLNTLPQVIDAGINDWGGVSPVTPDYVNPEAPWPHLESLASQTYQAGKYLDERLTIYPNYALHAEKWAGADVQKKLIKLHDGQGLARRDRWLTGANISPPDHLVSAITSDSIKQPASHDITSILQLARAGKRLNEKQIQRLFEARGDEFSHICQAANELRQSTAGNTVTYVVNRNINYTNICYFKCQFCAFSKGKLSENLRGRPYLLDHDEIARRTIEASQRGATEVCMQGGIHPEYTGQTYLDILQTVNNAVPDIHIHAFSPLEVWQGAKTLGLPLEEYLLQLKEAGLRSLPGTAAEVLDDGVRAILCPDKINSQQWLEVMATAHKVDLRSTATIMFGHVDGYHSWAKHLLSIRDLQERTGGFTEFVPLPFVAQATPIYLKQKSRRGPTFRESVLMHAIARLVLNPVIKNIQASWVKMGTDGIKSCLYAGVNDLGGTLMNETITRSAGACHGQELTADAISKIIEGAGRIPQQRNTLYKPVENTTIDEFTTTIQLTESTSSALV